VRFYSNIFLDRTLYPNANGRSIAAIESNSLNTEYREIFTLTSESSSMPQSLYKKFNRRLQ
jgi:hypothetical protein